MSRTTDKYIKIKREGDKAPENEIRIRADSRIGRSIAYAATLLLEKKFKTITIKASGAATKGACQVAEILRHKILGLHQVIQLKTNSVIDEYEPQEEGLDRVKVERKLAVLEIVLSLDASALDTKAPGYQAPLPKDQVSEEDLKTLVMGKRAQRGEREEGEGEGRREGGFRGERREGGRGFRRGRYAGGRGGRGRGFGGQRGEGRREGGYRGEGEGRREGGYRGGYRGEGERREGGYRGGNRGGRSKKKWENLLIFFRKWLLDKNRLWEKKGKLRMKVL